MYYITENQYQELQRIAGLLSFLEQLSSDSSHKQIAVTTHSLTSTLSLVNNQLEKTLSQLEYQEQTHN